jgi:hypothetical protein
MQIMCREQYIIEKGGKCFPPFSEIMGRRSAARKGRRAFCPDSQKAIDEFFFV